MQTLFWQTGSVELFSAESKKVFTDATVLPSIAILFYAEEILRREPRKKEPNICHIQLAAFNNRWSVYCLNYKAVLAVSVVDNETLDLLDLNKNQLLAQDIPLPQPA